MRRILHSSAISGSSAQLADVEVLLQGCLHRIVN
jgi:hypothetical protein